MIVFTSVENVFTVPSQVIVGGGGLELFLLHDKAKNTKANTDKTKYIFFINDSFDKKSLPVL